MDYLRNIGSAAASSLLQKSGIVLPFILGERVSNFDNKTIWTLHDAVKRDDSSIISVFMFDGSHPQAKKILPLAKNAAKKLKTIRHPHILKFIDGFETDSCVYIATERVRPLALVLDEEKFENVMQKEQWLTWGLERTASAVAFINEVLGAIHGNLRQQSIFVSRTGEWQLGGFEVLTIAKSEESILYSSAEFLPGAQLIASPEVKTGGWAALRGAEIGSYDAYCIGLLIHSLFNPSLPPPIASIPPFPPPTQSARGSIPLPLFAVYKKLLHPKASSRLRPNDMHRMGMDVSGSDGRGWFAQNNLVQICTQLDGMPLLDDTDKLKLLRHVENSTPNLPPHFCAYRIVPSLMATLKQGGQTMSAVLPIAFKLSLSLPRPEFLSIVILPAVKLFPNQDRTVRMALLEALPDFIDKVDIKLVSEQIWLHLQGGFSDTVPIVREATVRSILHIYPKLSERILNNDLLRHLARMQSDTEASIRTNTCILIGRLAPALGIGTKRKVLAPAFAKALRDSFVHTRVAGLAAFAANIDCFEPEEISLKVLPVVVTVLIDKEKVVRDQAFKTLQAYLKKVEGYVSTLSETTNVNNDNSQNADTRETLTSSLVTSAAGAAGALAGWTWSSIGKKIANGDIASSAAVSGSIDGFNSPANPLITIEGTRIASTSLSDGKAMRLPQTNSNNLSDLMNDLETDTEASAFNDRVLDDWGSFDVTVPENLEGLEPTPLSNKPATLQASDMLVQSIVIGNSAQVTKPSPSPLSTKSRSVTPEPEKSNLPQPTTDLSRSLTTISKEDKLTEIARRKEERKQRIANLKQQNNASKR